MYTQLIRNLVQQEGLPASYGADAETWFGPLAAALIQQQGELAATLWIGISGAQGTGKSTLALLLARCLEANGLTVANLSIDDFYLSRQRRRQLAQQVHPLLATRGVPGTHDCELLLATMAALAAADADSPVPLPAFDKSVDDCVPRENWRSRSGPFAAVIVEGWFVGARPQSQVQLAEPVNSLEREEDSDGRWRNYVNQCLGQSWQAVFDQLDTLIMLQAPSMQQVFQWRLEQEEKLRARSAPDAPGIMDEKQLARFIQHFERLTRHCLDTLPQQADLVFELDAHHRVRGKL